MTDTTQTAPPVAGASKPDNNSSNTAVKGRKIRRFTADLSAVGEPALWGFGGALALGIILIAGLLAMITWNGLTTFWPKPIAVVTLLDNAKLAGEPTRGADYRVGQDVLPSLNDAQRKQILTQGGIASRTLYKTANFDLYGNDFRWISEYEVSSRVSQGVLFI